MYSERALAFPCAGDWLYGVASLPASQPGQCGVLVVVGGPQYRAGSHRQFTLLSRALADAGIPAMRFDYRGMGDSEGAMRIFESVDEDIRAAIDRFMAEVPCLRQVALWGLCDGAAAAAMYAPKDARVRGLALLNPWVRTEDGAARATIRHYYGARVLQREFWKKVIGGRFDVRAAGASLVSLVRTALSRSQPDDQAASLPDRLLAALRSFDGEVLVMLSGADLTAQEFADLSGQPKWKAMLGSPRVERHTLPKADHTCSKREWHEQVAAWTIAWAAKLR